MRKTARDDETADYRSAAMHTIPPDVDSRATLIGYLLRLARLRSRKAGEDADDAISSQGRKPDHARDTARSSMEAGMTRGLSLLFYGFGGRR